MNINANLHLSFDIEEYFQVENLRTIFPPSSWDFQESTVEKNINRILSVLDQYDVKGTFFFLGKVAEKVPHLVKKIFSEGHEIASHGYGHLLTHSLSVQELQNDLLTSKRILEDIISNEIYGYRAPSFSINDRLLQQLANTGYSYDSSYNPFRLNSRYGSFTIPVKKQKMGYLYLDNHMIEVPVGYTPLLKQIVPSGGGAYFRIFPMWIYKRLLFQALQKSEQFTFYLHPWEFEPEQPKVNSIPLFYRFRHYYGLKSTSLKLRKLLQYLRTLGINLMPIYEGIQRTGLLAREN